MTEEETQDKCIIAIRIRGTVSAKREARETLQMLHLTRNNYAVLIDNRKSFLGMLQTVQSYVTWGEISKEVLYSLIRAKGRITGNKKLTEEYIKKAGYTSLEELAEAITGSHVRYWKLPKIQPYFRLRPPTKGFKGNIKKSYNAGGEAGYRGEKINELIKRMF